jgi:hypothetical protein
MRHEYEISSACGHRWRLVVDSDVELEQVECAACGADAFDITEIGWGFEP